MQRLILLGILLWPASAFAQTPVDAPASAVPPQSRLQDPGLAAEIVVTAQRRAENLQDTPIAVTALSPQLLETRQITSTLDLAKTVPNLTLLPVTASRSTVQVSLRGGSEQAGGLVTSEPAVAFYVDDVYRGRLAGSNLEFNDIERIEVLRGPQGTLYGRNAFSGAVKVVSRSPLASSWANASALYGSYDKYKLTASAGGKIADQLGGSLSVLFRDEGGYINNLALGRKVGKEQNLAVRGKVEGRPLDGVTATAIVSYTRDRNDASANVVPTASQVPFPTTAANFITTRDLIFLGGGPYTSLSPIPPDGRTDQFVASLDVRAELGAATLRSITAYVNTKDGFRFDLSGGRRLPAGGYYSSSLERTSDARTDQFSQEFQLLGTALDSRLNYIAGLYYFQEDSRQVLNDNLTIAPGFVLTVLPTTLQTRVRSYAAFAQLDYELVEHVSVVAGLRYTKDDKHLDATIQNRLPFGPGPAIASTEIVLDPSFGSWTPKAGINWKPTDNLLVYFSASRGFKAGGFNGLAVANPAVVQTIYQPQTVWAYEIGAKLVAFDRKVTADLALFRNEFSGLQQTQQIGPGSFATNNVGTGRLDGFELELTAAPVERLNLYANLALNHDQYERLNPASDAAVYGASRLPLTSRWSYQLGGSYDTAVIGNVGSLRFAASYAERGNFYSVLNNLLRTDGYGLLDASIALIDPAKHWSLTAAARNLTDRTYFTTAGTADAIAVGQPRTWTIAVRYDF